MTVQRKRTNKDKDYCFGKKHYQWSGYWKTPVGIFETLQEAGDALGYTRANIRYHCKKGTYGYEFIPKYDEEDLNE